jgi:hypothetical protein
MRVEPRMNEELPDVEPLLIALLDRGVSLLLAQDHLVVFCAVGLHAVRRRHDQIRPDERALNMSQVDFGNLK